MATFQPRIDRPVGRQSGGLAQAARRPSSRKCRFDATGDAASAAREPPQAGEGRKRDPHPAGEAEDFSRIRDVGKSARKVEKFLMVKYNRPNLDATQPPDFDGGDRLPSRTNLSNSAFTERGRSSGVEHNLAKVGVEGSNPFARSRFLQENEAVKTVLRGRFLLPRPPRESWGSRGEAAESEKQRATGCRRHGRHPKATVCRLRDRRQWVALRSTTKAGFGRHRASQDAQARPILLHRRRWRRECETHHSALPPARRIGSTSRSESGNRTNPCAA